jgi:uncharacterized protein
MNIERRYLSATGPDGARVMCGNFNGKRTIQGYAAVFNSMSNNLGDDKKQIREVIRPGAFAPLLAKGCDTRALVDHNPTSILGRTKSGTLRLDEDSRGLRFEIDPPETQIARDLMCSLERGDVDGSSFGFTVAPGGDAWRSEGGCYVREIRAFASLTDVSVVTYPAYPAAEACLRSLSDWTATHPGDVEIRATSLGDLTFGDIVQWWDECPDQLCAVMRHGTIRGIAADGPLGIDGTSLTLVGTADDPAALIAVDDGLCLRLFSQVTKVIVGDYERSLRTAEDRLRLVAVVA